MAKSFVDVIIHASRHTAPDGVSPVLRVSSGYHAVLVALGYGMEQVPVAALLSQYHALSGHWQIATPLHWEATHNDALVRAAGESLELTDAESYRLFTAYADFVAEDHMRLHYHDASTWLLQSQDHPVANAPPAHTLVGASIKPALQTLESTPFWLRFMTETQMFFSMKASDVNGIWVWGGAHVPPAFERVLVVCGDAVWLNASSVVSRFAQIYNPNARAVRKGVYFLPDADWISEADLTHHLRDNWVRWHWNDMTYVTKPRSWFARLWNSSC